MVLGGIKLMPFIVIAILLGIGEDVHFLEEYKSHVKKLIEAWIQNPKLFPNRISGIVLCKTEQVMEQNIPVPDFLVWDPLTQYQLKLTCPRCLMLGESNLLYATRWKDGKASHDDPRRIYCIQREVFLVSRIYRCRNGHQTLAHDSWTLKTISSHTQIPFVLFHKSGVTRDLYHYIYTHVQAGVKLTDIEYFLKQMYHDEANSRTALHNALSLVSMSIDSPGRQIVTNCFVRSYFENEHMYTQHTLEILCKWLSCDHTFKVSANIGFWHKGVWIKQYDSLFCVLNEYGQVVAWQLTKGTAFDKIKTLLTNLNARAKDRAFTTNFYIDNCCAWRGKLKEVFGDNVEIKLDLFHAVQRTIKTIPKRGRKDSVVKMIRRRMINDFTMIFRDPSDNGPTRTMTTPSKRTILEQLDNFLFKWKKDTYSDENILPRTAITEINNLRKHIERGCLSGIPPSCGSNRNEAMHKTLRKNISRQRLGIQLALALLGIGLFTWNQKRDQKRTQNYLQPIQAFYSSFLETGKTATVESFGISVSERQHIMPKISSDVELDTSPVFTDAFQNFFTGSQHAVADPASVESNSDSDNEAECDPFLLTATAIVKTEIIKTRLLINLAGRIKAKPKCFAKNMNFTKASLPLLGNSMFESKDDAGNRVDAILKGYGLERVFMSKDGNCLFSSISFFIVQIQSAEQTEPSNKLREHLETLGISPNQQLSEISNILRKLVVREFLGSNMSEYSSFLISADQMSYEETEKSFENHGFFDCELGNAAILALANIMRIGIVVFTSLENFPVITIVSRNEPIACTTAYSAFEQLGAGHYDAVIESTIKTTFADYKPGSNRTRQDNLDHSDPHNYHTACRCGQGAAKNKQVRKFCAEYKSSCKCFRSLKGCTVMCGCRKCANPYGIRIQAENEMSSGTQERKRRKHTKSPETGRNFLMERGQNTVDAPRPCVKSSCVVSALCTWGKQKKHLQKM